jgi:hypothetical protein
MKYTLFLFALLATFTATQALNVASDTTAIISTNIALSRHLNKF